MQVITTMGELDAKLGECDAALKHSDAAMRDVFMRFRMDFSTEVPADPFSAEYMDFQMALYRRIAGKEYRPQNEVSKFDVHEANCRPFPYSTGSCRTAGFFTMGMGFLLHSLDLAPGARVLEFGPGWGNTTMAMAMVGLDVTAVDIEPNFCDLLRLRAKRQEVDLTVVNADFFWAETVQKPFDAVLFFECFHHCSDHRRLLASLDKAIKPGGRIYFAAEPINAEFPLPWGLRMDGESLWAIRQNGWLELGFQESYFQQALARAGWVARKHAIPDIGWAAVWEARRIGAIQPVASAPDVSIVPAPPPSADTAALQRELAAVYNSTSWRLTAPLRAIKRRLGS